jgi:GNAT superfamily N-acetyltransferase
MAGSFRGGRDPVPRWRVASSPMFESAALAVRPLTPERFADLAALFGQGGDPKWCWCAYFRVRGRNWTNSTAVGNREVLETATRSLTEAGRAPGLLAYDGKIVVGWVSLGPRSDYDRLTHSSVLAPVDDAPVWSIVCFVVGRRSRGRGLAGALLDAAIDYARDHGATTLEAYPVDLAGSERIPSANAYTGTLAMFERAGFTVVARRQANAATRVRPIVRLRL